MNRNRICRPTINRDPQFFIRCSEIAFDEKVRYVESVCQVLIESRFGACLVEPVTIDLSDDAEPAAFSDLLDDEPNGQVSFYAFLSLGRADYQVVEAAYRKAKQMGLFDKGSNALNSTFALTPNQGRSSP